MELKLSVKQMDRIKYESNLLQCSIQTLYTIAPYLFQENITAANTESKEPEEKSDKEKDLEKYKEQIGKFGYVQDEEEYNVYGY
jgi:hypothetical protein